MSANPLLNLLSLLLVTLALAPAFSVAQTTDETIDLKIHFAKNQQCLIRADVEHEGDVLIVSDEDGNKAIKSLPLKVNGKLKFYQRPTSATQALRYFENAEAKIKLDKGNKTPEIESANRATIVRLRANRGGRPEMASIGGLLSQQELELIQNPADPLTLQEVFTKDNIKIGDSWKPAPDALARFLNVDRIESSDVELTLKKLDRKLARVYLSGNAVAAINDVTTEMSVSCIAVIDTGNDQVRNLKLGIDETRSVGQIEPGFDGKTRIDIGFDFEKSTDQLSNAALGKIVQSKKIQQRLKYASEPGAFQITYDPRWKLIAGEADTALMRFIDRGELLTQCNVVLLPRRPADKPLSLETFKTEIAKAIDVDKQAELVTSSKNTTQNGLTSLNVIVEGEEEGLPVNWFYYHVSGKDGRQITFVFTLAGSVSGRVKSIAQQLVDEFQFLDLKTKVATKSKQPRR